MIRFGRHSYNEPSPRQRIVIRQEGTQPETLAELARRRFAFALGRFGTHVRSLTVRLRDVNGPRGGQDKHCRVSLQLSGSRRQIVVEDIDTNPGAVIDRTADRAARAVSRAVDALHDWQSPSGRQRR